MSQLPSESPTAPAILAAYQTQVQQMQPIHLDEMGAVQLQNRVDTKFVLTQRQLLQALGEIGDAYRVLDVEGVRLNQYRSLYFDTADFAFYLQHHNGQTDRYKVRYREYVDSKLAFIEVKIKTNKQRTIKYRQRVGGIATVLDESAQRFVQPNLPMDVRQLVPKLWNSFLRITLVSKTEVERLTLDLHLRFRRDRLDVWLSPIAVAEVKQEKFSVHSYFVQQMRTLGVQPRGFSKYCIGSARLYPFLKQNRFKETFLHLERLRRANETQNAPWDTPGRNDVPIISPDRKE